MPQASTFRGLVPGADHFRRVVRIDDNAFRHNELIIALALNDFFGSV